MPNRAYVNIQFGCLTVPMTLALSCEARFLNAIYGRWPYLTALCYVPRILRCVPKIHYDVPKIHHTFLQGLRTEMNNRCTKIMYQNLMDPKYLFCKASIMDHFQMRYYSRFPKYCVFEKVFWVCKDRSQMRIASRLCFSYKNNFIYIL